MYGWISNVQILNDFFINHNPLSFIQDTVGFIVIVHDIPVLDSHTHTVTPRPSSANSVDTFLVIDMSVNVFLFGGRIFFFARSRTFLGINSFPMIVGVTY